LVRASGFYQKACPLDVTGKSRVQIPLVVCCPPFGGLFFMPSIGMADLLKKTITGSLAAQWSTLLVNFYGLAQPLAPQDALLKKVLGLETIVQIIELIFYHWYHSQIQKKVFDVAHFRYYDWALTTPTMLFSTMLFYEYIRDKPTTIGEVLEKKGSAIGIILLLNMGMLVFGFLQEIGIISITTSTLFGFASFLASFYLIYENFVKDNEKQGVYFFMLSVWSLYGVAAFFDDLWKNISYNLLDIVAKNFYGVYLSYYIATLAGSNSKIETAGTT
jgi:hypothetical protein